MDADRDGSQKVKKRATFVAADSDGYSSHDESDAEQQPQRRKSPRKRKNKKFLSEESESEDDRPAQKKKPVKWATKTHRPILSDSDSDPDRRRRPYTTATAARDEPKKRSRSKPPKTSEGKRPKTVPGKKWKPEEPPKEEPPKLPKKHAFRAGQSEVERLARETNNDAGEPRTPAIQDRYTDKQTPRKEDQPKREQEPCCIRSNKAFWRQVKGRCWKATSHKSRTKAKDTASH